MKKITILLSLALLLAVSCEKSEHKSKISDIKISDISFTPYKQEVLKNTTLSGNVTVEFTHEGILIRYYDFEVLCDFTTVNVTHTFTNGVLNITQESDGSAKCICYSDVSYAISGISKNQVNEIFINGEQVYCHNNPSDCDQDVIVSTDEYENAPNHPISIIDMRIEGNCLKIKFSASGCSGDNWIVKLIDSEAIAKSLPCQRFLRLSLADIGLCCAYFEKEISFNIEDLQIQGYNSVLLNISGKSILYEY